MNYKELFSDNKTFVFKAFIVFLFGLILVNSFKNGHDYKDESNLNTITITGHGEVNAVADIATITFSITKDAKTIKEAQAAVAEIEKNTLTSLEQNKVDKKDIKTNSSSFYPKYEYQYEARLVPCSQFGCPPDNGKSVIVGYTATESITVKVRNTDEAGKIIADLGALGVNDLYGPNFAIDDEDGLKAQARKKAIDEAKEKAHILAKDLGIRLGKLTSFSETPNYGSPIYYAKATLESADAGANAVPSLPKGENTITSDVTITYKIK